MKEFNLQEAINGHPLVTRDGRKVEQFFYFDKSTDDMKAYAVFDGAVHSFSDKGRFNVCESDLDLFMAPKTYYVNVYEDNGIITLGPPRPSEDEAKEKATNVFQFIKTISFEL